jgi:hypothetical protein
MTCQNITEQLPNGKYHHTCQVCGTVRIVRGKRLVAECGSSAPRIDYSLCQHRGDELRREQCETCCGTVRIKVYDCAIHVECTIDQRLENVTGCNGCKEYSPPPTP